MRAAEVRARLMQESVAPAAAAGCAARGPQRPAWTCDSAGGELIFDLASVTKPMTAVAMVRAGVDLREPLGAWIEEARGTASEHVSLELLLAHRAGLDAHRPLYAPLVSGQTIDVRRALRVAADARRGDASGDVPAEGFEPLYSDLGYLLAGEVLARATGSRDAGEAISRLVIEPLGMTARAGTVRELAGRGVVGPFVPTEDVPWRGGVVTGQVHDENAWALTGEGGSGHAGIFATVDAVLAFGMAVLDSLDALGGPLGAPSLEVLVKERPGGTLRAGFDGKSSEGSSAGVRMSARSFGHLGFTGTSLWVDPDAKVVVSVLTNRVHPTREHHAIRSARPWAHDGLWERARELTSGT